MNPHASSTGLRNASRELLLHALYEAAELEHNLLCTYLYAAFSLRCAEAEGLSAKEAATVARWRREMLAVAIDEMSHLPAVWNITADTNCSQYCNVALRDEPPSPGSRPESRDWRAP